MIRFLFSYSKVKKINHLKLSKWAPESMIYATAIVGDENENLWQLKLLLSFLGMIGITKAHWQASSGILEFPWKSDNLSGAHRHFLQNSMWVLVLACAWIIKFSRLPHGANVNVFPLLKTTKTYVHAHQWILTLHSVWTTCVTYSEHPAWLFSLKALCLFGDACSNIVLSLVSPHKVRCEDKHQSLLA